MAPYQPSFEERQRWRYMNPAHERWAAYERDLLLPPYLRSVPQTRDSWAWNYQRRVQAEAKAKAEVEEARADLVTEVAELRAFARRAVAELKAENAANERREVLLSELHLAHMRRLYAAWRKLAAKAGFNPDQPRVPAGNSEGGQWTSGEDGGGAVGDARVRLAGPTGAVGRRQAIALRYPNATPAQQARLAAFETQADAAARAVREIDPHWRREPSFQETIEGQIRIEEAAANAARARLDEFGQLGISREAMRPGGIIRPTEGIFMPEGRLVGVRIGGATDNIHTVEPLRFSLMRDDLLIGASPIRTPSSYRGLWFERADGMRFGLSMSEDHGPTIDVLTNGRHGLPRDFKVHMRCI